MATPSWIQCLHTAIMRGRSTRQRRQRSRQVRPRVLVLEDRVLPSTFNQFPVPTPSSAPGGIAIGADGNLWFTEEASGTNNIGRITTAGTITEFPVSVANTRPWGIAAGPDGNVWFTSEGDGVPSEVGRITPSGTMTLFPILSADAYPSVTAGPDGNLWVTEATSNQIAVVSPQGMLLNQFNIPISGGVPEDIATGPD
jgi:virginiamycin B lyase